jgi:hypothetical protein
MIKGDQHFVVPPEISFPARQYTMKRTLKARARTS